METQGIFAARGNVSFSTGNETFMPLEWPIWCADSSYRSEHCVHCGRHCPPLVTVHPCCKWCSVACHEED